MGISIPYRTSGPHTRTHLYRRPQQPNHNSPIMAIHNYHDFAAVPCPDDFSLIEEADRATGDAPFPTKLYNMLDSIDTMGYASIVSWQSHGRCFIVHKKDELKALLPNFFKLTKITSFHRQLNLYGFMRISTGRDRSAYYHENFLRGKPSLLCRMQRIKIKGTGIRARDNPDSEPDFWCMRPVRHDDHGPRKALPLPLASSASVVSEHCSKNHRFIHEQRQLSGNIIKYLDSDLEPLPFSRANDKALIGWGMPAMHTFAQDLEIINEHGVLDEEADADLVEVLQDILTEADELFTDELKNIVAV
jgi:hypothetical protein